MFSGINHITFAVRHLQNSIGFYQDVLEFTLKAQWDRGAYLESGSCWLCLTLDPIVQTDASYTHVAFSICELNMFSLKQKINDAQVKIWKENSSEGDSVYFLDPDGHKLEAHSGDLLSRLQSLRNAPYDGLKVY